MKNIENYINLIEKNKNYFDIYYQNLISYNEKVNLTSIIDKNEVFIKHFLDSILSVDEIQQNARLIDVGAGAGFPSLPIKIVRPDIDITMLDSLNKRITFLNYICEKLNIKSTNIHMRAEDFAKTNREKFDVGVARAVAKLNTLAEYILPLLKVGGIMIAYKGSNIDEELTQSKSALTILGGKHVKTLHFTLPNEMGERNIVIIKKVNPTPVKYPRDKNLPKLKPL